MLNKRNKTEIEEVGLSTGSQRVDKVSEAPCLSVRAPSSGNKWVYFSYFKRGVGFKLK